MTRIVEGAASTPLVVREVVGDLEVPSVEAVRASVHEDVAGLRRVLLVEV
jgi:hypothetical protein